jgi:hypothetical protein
MLTVTRVLCVTVLELLSTAICIAKAAVGVQLCTDCHQLLCLPLVLVSLQVCQAVVMQDARPPVPAGIPQDYCELMVHCWAREPFQRPSMTHVSDASTQS